MQPPENPPNSDTVKSLEARISLLSDLSTRLDSLRQTPTHLRPQLSGPISAQPTFIRQGFQNIKDFTQTVQSEPIQDVLKAAKESATKDSSDLDFSHRRVRNVKQRSVADINSIMYLISLMA